MRGPALAVAAAVALAGAPAAAQPAEIDLGGPDARPRPFRISIGGGGSLLLTGTGGGDRLRGEAHLSVLPGGALGRWGVTAAVRHATLDPVLDDALITVGVLREAAAARPRLALALHADVGLTLASTAPALGGGVETTLWLVPNLAPVALVFDVTGHLVLDGVRDTRFVLAAATRLSLAF